jgi:hypothetical protein
MAHGDAREGKCRGKLANGVGSQLIKRDRRSQLAQRYYHVTTTMCTLRLLQPDYADTPDDSNGLVLFSEIRNLVSAHGPSRFNPTIAVSCLSVRTKHPDIRWTFCHCIGGGVRHQTPYEELYRMFNLKVDRILTLWSLTATIVAVPHR